MKLFSIFLPLSLVNCDLGGDLEAFEKRLNALHSKNQQFESDWKATGRLAVTKQTRSCSKINHWTVCPNLCHLKDGLEGQMGDIAHKIMPQWELFKNRMDAKKVGIAKEFETKLDYIDDGENQAKTRSLDLEAAEDQFLTQLGNHATSLTNLNEQLIKLKGDYKDLAAELVELSKQTSGYKIECDRIAPCRAVPNCQLGVQTGKSCQDIADKSSETVEGEKYLAMPQEGIHLIKPSGLPPREVICKFTSTGSGYTVFQRRFEATGNQEDFNQNWDSYKNGFGSAVHMNTEKCSPGEYWLGNEYVSKIMGNKPSALAISMERFNGDQYTIGYEEFRMGNEREAYKLKTIGKFHDNNNAGNALMGASFGNQGYSDKDQTNTIHVGMKFSTYDKDNDKSKGNCAEEDRSGWWFNKCSAANLNGHYYSKGQFDASKSNSGEYDDGILWMTATKNKWESLKTTSMMIGPNLDILSEDSFGGDASYGSNGTDYGSDYGSDYSYGEKSQTIGVECSGRNDC